MQATCASLTERILAAAGLSVPEELQALVDTLLDIQGCFREAPTEEELEVFTGDSLRLEVVRRYRTLPSPEEVKEWIVPRPMIYGAWPINFLHSQFHFDQFSKYYFGRSFQSCSEAERKAIVLSDEFQEMPSYPSKGFISVINDITVIKLEY
jgi:hypothetical protein